ncbi:MAG: hypothetical protein KDJ37_01930 [Hyphomicrobiaceae bacterium]|nr:hypothetical protein [Hyphomicrobiaceae bacterium]
MFSKKPTAVPAIILGLVLMTGLARVSTAQSNPPPPADEPAQAAPAGGATAEPAPPRQGATRRGPAGVLDDIKDQDAANAIEKERETLREMVNQARQSAQRFRIARAQLTDIIAEGKCGGVASVLQGIARQEQDTRKLLTSLEQSCGSARQGSALASTCRDERDKLSQELSGYDDDRDALRRMCPGKVN